MLSGELQRRRGELGLTQSELAARLGVSLRAVQHWEGGDRRVPEPVARLLAALRPRRSQPANS
jgi:DNA-binding transcriptional regulator YiaG